MCLIVLYRLSLPCSPSLLFIASSNGDATRYNWKGAKNHVMVLMQQFSGLWGPKRLLLQSVTSRLEHDSQPWRQAGLKPASSPLPCSPLPHPSFSGERTGQLGTAWWAKEQGGESRAWRRRSEARRLHYSSCLLWVCQSPPPIHPENEGLSSKQKSHLTKFVMGMAKHTVTAVTATGTLLKNQTGHTLHVCPLRNYICDVTWIW